MKILIVVRILWPGGVQRTAFAEAEGLSKLGNEVDLVFLRDTDMVRYNSELNFRVVNSSEANGRLFAGILRFITFIYNPQRGSESTVDIDLVRKFEHSIEYKYDIIYYYDEFAALFANYSKKRWGNKVIVMIHEVALSGKTRLWRLIQKRVMRNADLILTNTNENLSLMKKSGISHAIAIYPGTHEMMIVNSFEERENQALSVTMWDFGRKPELLIEIAKYLKKGKILIAGSWTDSAYMKKVIDLISINNLEEKVVVTGPISEEDLATLYKISKVAIRFGYNEKGPGMGSLEALSYGLPLLVNNGIGAKEFVKPSINGYIVNESNAEATARLIDDLFENSTTWKSISRNNVTLAKNLSWENHCKVLNDRFNSLLTG